MLRQPLCLRPNTTYILLLRARALGQPTAVLSYDLTAPNYGYPEQYMAVYQHQLTHSFKNYFKVINTGPGLPNQVSLRVFTYSKTPLVIRDAQIKEVTSNFPPFLGRVEPGEKPDGEGILLYKKVFAMEGIQIFENRNCLPRVFAVERIETVRDLSEVKKKLYLFKINPLRTALVYKQEMAEIGQSEFSPGKVMIRQYDTDQVVVDADFAGRGFMILADQYYPGWRATVDGTRTPIYRVNGMLRGIVIPPGRHIITFEYRPVKIYTAAAFSGVVLLGCFVALGTSVFRNRFFIKSRK
jgi:hypothetical protein